MNLSERMKVWGELQLKADNLAKEIKAEVMALGRTQTVGSVTATYLTGRGKYDYRAIATAIAPGRGIIDRNTKVVTNWRNVCTEANASVDVMEQFFTRGKPNVGLSLSETYED